MAPTYVTLTSAHLGENLYKIKGKMQNKNRINLFIKKETWMIAS